MLQPHPSCFLDNFNAVRFLRAAPVHQLLMNRATIVRALPLGLVVLAIAALCGEVALAAPQEAAGDGDYRALPFISSRVVMWVVAELHLMFAAFVLAVPMFAIIIEFIGYKTGDHRFDDLAHDFTRLLSVSFSFTATLGALLTFGLIIFYPTLTQYLVKDLQLDVSALRPAILPGGLFSLCVLLRVGQVFTSHASVPGR